MLIEKRSSAVMEPETRVRFPRKPKGNIVKPPASPIICIVQAKENHNNVRNNNSVNTTTTTTTTSTMATTTLHQPKPRPCAYPTSSRTLPTDSMRRRSLLPPDTVETISIPACETSRPKGKPGGLPQPPDKSPADEFRRNDSPRESFPPPPSPRIIVPQEESPRPPPLIEAQGGRRYRRRISRASRQTSTSQQSSSSPTRFTEPITKYTSLKTGDENSMPLKRSLTPYYTSPKTIPPQEESPPSSPIIKAQGGGCGHLSRASCQNSISQQSSSSSPTRFTEPIVHTSLKTGEENLMPLQRSLTPYYTSPKKNSLHTSTTNTTTTTTTASSSGKRKKPLTNAQVLAVTTTTSQSAIQKERQAELDEIFVLYGVDPRSVKQDEIPRPLPDWSATDDDIKTKEEETATIINAAVPTISPTKPGRAYNNMTRQDSTTSDVTMVSATTMASDAEVKLFGLESRITYPKRIMLPAKEVKYLFQVDPLSEVGRMKAGYDCDCSETDDEVDSVQLPNSTKQLDNTATATPKRRQDYVRERCSERPKSLFPDGVSKLGPNEKERRVLLEAQRSLSSLDDEALDELQQMLASPQNDADEMDGSNNSSTNLDDLVKNCPPGLLIVVSERTGVYHRLDPATLTGFVEAKTAAKQHHQNNDVTVTNNNNDEALLPEAVKHVQPVVELATDDESEHQKKGRV